MVQDWLEKIQDWLEKIQDSEFCLKRNESDVFVASVVIDICNFLYLDAIEYGFPIIRVYIQLTNTLNLLVVAFLFFIVPFCYNLLTIIAKRLTILVTSHNKRSVWGSWLFRAFWIVIVAVQLLFIYVVVLPWKIVLLCVYYPFIYCFRDNLFSHEFVYDINCLSVYLYEKKEKIKQKFKDFFMLPFFFEASLTIDAEIFKFIILFFIIWFISRFGMMFFFKSNKQVLWNGFMYLQLNLILFIFNFFFWFSDTNVKEVIEKFVFLKKNIVLAKYNFELILDFISVSLTLEAVSRSLILLTVFIFFLAALISLKHIEYGIQYYCFLLLFLQLLLFIIFCVTNLSFFYILFEFILLPVFLLIGMWGSRDRKVFSSLQFFIMTLFFSLLFFGMFLYFRLLLGYNFLVVSFETNMSVMPVQIFSWYFILFSFLVKLPVIPLHFWLPEAHGEASTAGSMILAGILLKLGSYGIYKFLLDFSDVSDYFYVCFLYLLLLISATYSTIVILKQTDLKKLIAYSSVSHMAIVAFGLFSFTYDGIDGAIFLMISHGLVSCALFMSVGVLYDRYKTRATKNFAGISYFMPIFSFFFLVFVFANMGLPGTSGFIGEFLIFNNLSFSSLITVIFLFFAFFLTGCYTVWHMVRLLYTPFASVTLFSYCDLTFKEFVVFFFFLLFIVIFGLYSSLFFDFLY